MSSRFLDLRRRRGAFFRTSARPHTRERILSRPRRLTPYRYPLAAPLRYIVEGGSTLAGSIHPSGNKNAALPIIAAALLTDQKVTLENVPRIRDCETLVELMHSLGVSAEWTARNTLVIEAKVVQPSALDPVLCARIRASILLAGPLLARCGGVTLPPPGGDVIGRRRVDTHFLALEQLGTIVEIGDDLLVSAKQSRRIQTDLGGHVPKLEDQPWPAFPADLMSIAIVTATQCEGLILMHEKMFESRMFFVDKLSTMGARIVLCDPHRALISGPSRLRGAFLESPDIRAGMALLLAALCAEGTSFINNVGQIERGYERIDERLNALGASITRVDDRRA